MVTRAKIEEIEAEIEQLKRALRELGVEVGDLGQIMPSSGLVPFLGWIGELTGGGDTGLHTHGAEAWQTPTLLNGWENLPGFTTCQYFKDSFGIVYLKGLVRWGPIGSAIFNLPSGYRPAQWHTFIAISCDALAKLTVQNDGPVMPNIGNNDWFCLDGVGFRAA